MPPDAPTVITASPYVGPTAATPGGVTAGTFTGPTAATPEGVTAGTYTGPTASAPGGVTAGNYTGPTAATPEGVTAGTYTGPTASAPGGVTAGTYTGPTASTPGGVTAGTYASPDSNPTGAVAATLATAFAGANNDLVFTAVEEGASGNAISIAIAVNANATSISIVVDGASISIASGLSANIAISGTLSPDYNGLLVPIGVPTATWLPNTLSWSTTGSATAPGSGTWVIVRPFLLATPESKTLDQIWPKAFATGYSDPTNGSRISIWNGAIYTNYYMWDNGTLKHWTVAGDGTLADMGATVIPTSSGITIYAANEGAVIHNSGGGLYETWNADPEKTVIWYMDSFINGSSPTGYWLGTGNHPATATWTATGAGTGTPVAQSFYPSDLITAIQANSAAPALVTVANAPGNDGSGSVATLSATNLTGGADASFAPPLPIT